MAARRVSAEGSFPGDMAGDSSSPSNVHVAPRRPERRALWRALATPAKQTRRQRNKTREEISSRRSDGPLGPAGEKPDGRDRKKHL